VVTPRQIAGADWWYGGLPPENKGATVAIVTHPGTVPEGSEAWTYIGSTVFKITGITGGSRVFAYDLARHEAVPAYIGSVLDHAKDKGKPVKLYTNTGQSSIAAVIIADVTRRYMRGQFPYTPCGQPVHWGSTLLTPTLEEPKVDQDPDASVAALLGLITGKKEVVPASESVPAPRGDDSQSAGRSKTPPHRRAGVSLRAPSVYIQTLRPK
jgi:hypothetical protein